MSQSRRKQRPTTPIRSALTLAAGFALLLLVLGGALAPGVAAAGTPTLTTGLPDYAPDQVVDIHGSGFASATAYAIPVQRPDGSIVVVDPATHLATPGWQTTTSDASGNLIDLYRLDGVTGTYTARAYPSDWAGDWSLAPLAQVTFTDCLASIAITPSAAVNAVGTAHTFHVTVTAFPPEGTTPVFAAIVTSVTPAPSSISTTCADPTVDGNVATCTITINSTTAGVFTANARATVVMGGVTAEPDTAGDSGTGGSGPAVKRYVDASIRLSPPSALNEVGTAHTVTVTVTAIPSGATPVSFGSITTSVSPTPDLQNGSTCAAPSVSGDTATCTVTINSSTTGAFTFNAAADVTMGGVTVHRATDGNFGTGGTGPAQKYYGGASIAITPAGAVNEVGTEHVFHVTVTATPADDATVSLTTITTSVSPAPSSSSSTCDSPVRAGNVWTCDVTIDNTSAGAFTANAIAVLQMDGLTLTRSTSGTSGPAGSGPAVKQYIDASITIAPAAGVNEVDHSHTFAVTVTAMPGGATPVSFGTITTSIDPTPDGTEVSTCDTPSGTGNTRSCTVTIDSSTAGTFTANAAATVTMGEVTVSRSTSGNSGSDGSGPAVKNFVDASIAIGPANAVNQTGTLHTFTVTVTADPAGASPVIFSNINVSVLPTPDLENTNTCAEPAGTGNTRTCTVTINSSSEGTFTASASVDVTMGGVIVHRSTAADSGPHGSGPATKVYVSPTGAVLAETSGPGAGILAGVGLLLLAAFIGFLALRRPRLND